MRVLFIVPYPTEGPSNRYRVELFLPYLRSAGVECTVRPFMNSYFYSMLYKSGRLPEKIGWFGLSALGRVADVSRIPKCDLVFVHREAFPFGPQWFESLVARLAKPMVFDFDDAIYLQNASAANRFAAFLKYPEKTWKIVALSNQVIVCNHYLRNRALQYNQAVTTIPTSVDTDRFVPRSTAGTEQPLTIGWIGSHSTTPYLEQLKGVFSRLARRYDFELVVVGAGVEYQVPGVKVVSRPWRLDRELADFQSLDIGVYPLLNDEWAWGKGGFKVIQFFSVGVPAVVSPVGVSRDLVQDGVNGFFAHSEDQWVDRLSMLIEDAVLRRRMGEAGRALVEMKYSLKANAPAFLDVLNRAVSSARAPA